MTPEIKQDWLARAKMHQGADRFIKGQWLNGMVGDFRSGCFFGCMTQSEDNTLELAAEQMNSPEWIVRLAEKIFEGLPEGESELFPVQYMENIPSNLGDEQYEEIRHKLGVVRMRRMLELVSQIETKESYKQECIDSINLTINYHLSPSESAAESAARSAESAARSAESAARSAWSAESAARSAARSAWSAAWSAESAARSAESAAWSDAWSAESAARSAWSVARSAAWLAELAELAARSAAYTQERDDLFAIFKSYK